MKVRELMSTPVVSAPPVATAQEAALQMEHSGVGCLIVLDAGQIAGILTDRDVAIRVVAIGRPADVPVREVMTTPVVTVSPDDDIDLAVRTFRRHPIRRLPVVSEGVVMGLLTIDDLLLRSHQVLTDLLSPVSSEISEPQHAR